MFYEEVIGKRQVTAVNLPDNMTKYYHVLDLTVNRHAKAFTKKMYQIIRKRNSSPIECWYTNRGRKCDILAGCPLYARWVVKLSFVAAWQLGRTAKTP